MTALTKCLTRPTFLLTLCAALMGCGSSAATPADASPADAPSPDAVAVTDVPATPQDAPPDDKDAGPTPWTPDATSPATAITAPDETWTWVPFVDSACANGQPTGIAVNLTHRSQDAIIFLMGGGACWDGITCLGAMTATNVRDGYTEAKFRSERAGIAAQPFFDRADTRNPFRDLNMVFVPYCTGDIHGGNNITEYTWGAHFTAYHVGARNMESYLRRLVPTFANARRVWLAGSSAGGFGAGLNWYRVSEAFTHARVDLIDDSGPPMTPPGTRWETMRTAWNPQFPAECTECNTRLEALLEFYARRYGNDHRMALLSYTQDQTISTYMNVTGPEFETRLNALVHTQLDSQAHAKYFFVAGDDHTMMGSLWNIRAADGTLVGDWLSRMVHDDAGWASVHP